VKYSVNIKLRRPPRADGTCLVLLQVILEGQLVRINLKTDWTAEFFDEGKEWCRSSLPVAERPGNYKELLAMATAAAGGTVELLEKRAQDYNLIIGQALARANEVLVAHRLSKEPTALTPARFLLEFKTAGSREDFIKYYEARLTERYRKGQIKKRTWINQTSTLNALKEFRARIPFNTLDFRFADDWAEYLAKHVRGLNTRWGRHKDTKAYLALARKDKIRFEDPYTCFANSCEPGKWKPLQPAEHERMAAYYTMCAPRTVDRRVLAKFLFSCCSSLRLGDLKQIGQATLDGTALRFAMQKTYTRTLKETMLPLTNRALQYLQDAQAEEGLAGFYDYSDQYENRVLAKIGLQLGIETRLHHHVGRETFATDFIRRGGHVTVLQKFMGHSKISTTMKYVHVDGQMMLDEIAKMNAQDDVPRLSVA
jgi:site-specific recombinase XerD